MHACSEIILSIDLNRLQTRREVGITMLQIVRRWHFWEKWDLKFQSPRCQIYETPVVIYIYTLSKAQNKYKIYEIIAVIFISGSLL